MSDRGIFNTLTNETIPGIWYCNKMEHASADNDRVVGTHETRETWRNGIKGLLYAYGNSPMNHNPHPKPLHSRNHHARVDFIFVFLYCIVFIGYVFGTSRPLTQHPYSVCLSPSQPPTPHSVTHKAFLNALLNGIICTFSQSHTFPET